jgi:sensor histidine kinase regulating citrate/malate metabolism
MEQKSNVQYRAEKEYKNSREKFFLLLREIISNAIHAVLIRESKEKNYIPELNLDVVFDETQCKIELTDNGEGFNERNRKYFEELDKKTLKKKNLTFTL